MRRRNVIAEDDEDEYMNGENENNNNEAIMDDEDEYQEYSEDTNNNNETNADGQDKGRTNTDTPAEVTPSEEDIPEGEDVVVQRFDVFLSQNLTPNLYMFQFPLRPPDRPYEYNQLQELRVKPQNRKVEMQFALDQRGKHYDRESLQPLTSFTLSSTMIPPKTNYAIGVLRGNQLHITPLQNIVQLRPTFAHIDRAVEEQKARIIKTDEEKREEEEQEQRRAEAKAARQPELVSVQIKRKESSKEQAARMKTHAYLQEKEAEEEFQKFRFCGKSDFESGSMFEQLFAPSFTPVPFDIPKEKFIDTLVPYPPDTRNQQLIAESETPEHAKIEEPQLSMELLKTLPADEQITRIIMASKIMAYTRLKELATNAKSDEQIMPVLERVALLVNGTWIVKSELVYQPAIAARRDYILYLFTQQQYVERKHVAEKLELAPDVVRELLHEIAELRPGKGWELKVAKDEKFMSKFIEVVARQKKEWENRKAKILKNVATGFASVGPARGKVDFTTVKPTTNVDDVVGAVSRVIGSSVQQHVRRFFLEMFEKFGVCGLVMLKQQFANKQKADAVLNEANETMFQQVLNAIAKPFNNSYVLKTLGDPDVDKYRDVLLDLFQAKKTLKRAEIMKEVQDRLNVEIPPNVYSKILKEIAISKGGTWVAKT